MLVNILIQEDLQQFKAELMSELKSLFKKKAHVTKKWLK